MDRSGNRTEDAIRALEETLLRHVPDDPRFESGLPEGSSTIIAFPTHAVSQRVAAPQPSAESPDELLDAPNERATATENTPEDDTEGTVGVNLPPLDDESNALDGLRALIEELRGDDQPAAKIAPAVEPSAQTVPSDITVDDFESGVQGLIAELNALKADMAKLHDLALDDDGDLVDPSDSHDLSI